VSGWLHTAAPLPSVKVHLLNKRLGGPLEMVAKRKITASALNQLLVFSQKLLFLLTVSVSDLMLLKVTFGLN